MKFQPKLQMEQRVINVLIREMMRATGISWLEARGIVLSLIWYPYAKARGVKS